MKEELKKWWIDALRSGKYTQGKGALKKVLRMDGKNPTEYAYCCLGVLCEKLVKDGLLIQNNDSDVFINAADPQDKRTGRLGTSIDGQIGLDDSIESCLISMNDYNNQSFEEIATYLEENPSL